MTTVPILFISLIVLLLINVPIAASLGLACIFAMSFGGSVAMPLMTIPQRMFTAIDSFPYMAVPFFMLAGNLMGRGGISRRLVNFAKNVVGWLPGGLGIITVVSSAFFGAISGSNAATVAAIGGIMIPAMADEKGGYPRDYASAIAASAGTLGVVVPPSVPMVTYGVITGVSIGTLFISGFIPALLMVFGLSIVIILTSRKLSIPSVSFSVAELWASFKAAILALLTPFIILGGIYGGVFTPTEAAAVACLYSFIVTVFVYREIGWTDFVEIICESCKTTGMIFFIIAASNSFVWILTSQRIPEAIANAIISFSNNPYIILFLLNLLLLILGVMLETNSIILLVTPILLPIALSIGLDPLALGVIMVVNTSVGMITPPMAMNIIVASGIGKCSMEEISKKIWPFLLVLITVIYLITYFPQIIFFLPQLLGKIK